MLMEQQQELARKMNALVDPAYDDKKPIPSETASSALPPLSQRR